MKIQEFYQKYKKKIAVIAVGLVAILLLFLAAVAVFFFVCRSNTEPAVGQELLFGENTGEIIVCSGVTNQGSHQEKFEAEGLSEGLWIEKVYVECGTQLAEGDRVMKFSEESIALAREELEQAKRDAEMALHTGEVAYEESKITLRYEKERAVLESELAREIYNETVETLKEEETKALEELKEVNDQISEYEKLLDAKSSQDPYQVKAYKKIYDDNLKILTQKLDQSGFTWEQVAKGSVNASENEQLYVLQQFYDVLEQNLEDYEHAKADYDAAVTEATLKLQTLKLSLSSLEAGVEEAKAAYETDAAKAKLIMEQKLTAAEQAQENYVTKLNAAEAEYERLQDAKTDAEKNLASFAQKVGTGYYYASQEGPILQLGVSAEQYLTDNTMVYEYGVPKEMTVTLSVEQASVAAITVGEVAYIKSAEGGGFQGRVVEMNPIPQAEHGAEPVYQVKVAIEGDTEELAVGETVTVMFRVGGAANEETK